MYRSSGAIFCLLACTLCGCGSSIHDAVIRGNVPLVTAMLDANPGRTNDRDRLEKTPLHQAVSFKKLAMMDLLVSRGADIDAADHTGMTPLHVASMLGRGEEAAWLLDHGANPMARDHFGDTPLHTAAIFGGGKVVKPLLLKGAELTSTNTEGLTPLELARRYGQEKMIQYLEHLAQR